MIFHRKRNQFLPPSSIYQFLLQCPANREIHELCQKSNHRFEIRKLRLNFFSPFFFQTLQIELQDVYCRQRTKNECTMLHTKKSTRFKATKIQLPFTSRYISKKKQVQMVVRWSPLTN